MTTEDQNEADAGERRVADPKRDRFITKVERRLADIAAGRVRVRAEVRAWIAGRFAGSTRNRATMASVTDEATRILDAALQLPEAERAEIAAILEDSIGDGSSPEEVHASWMAEVRRRLAALERDETTLVDFDDVLIRLRAKVESLREQKAPTG